MKDYGRMEEKQYHIGAPACIMAAFTAFIPVLYLLSRLAAGPKLETDPGSMGTDSIILWRILYC